MAERSAAISFVLTFGSLRSSMILISSADAFVDRAERSASRFTFFGSFFPMSRGFGGKVTPPPRQCGTRVDPILARPVPFCRQGFRPPPLTSLRPFLLAVPSCWLAR